MLARKQGLGYCPAMMDKGGNATRPDGAERDFGFSRVDAEDHARLVGRVFDSVADRYDLMNDLMSGGLHRVWKHLFIDRLDPRPGMRLVDVAAGTGDIAFRIRDRLEERFEAQASTQFLCDPNQSMLDQAQRRATDQGWLDGFTFINAPAENLPLDDHCADGITISFGLRNVTDRAAGLAEMHRVLDFGGHFLCLEFSPSVLPVLEPLYEAYSWKVLPWLGQQVTGDGDSYRYLVESIRKFPAPDALADEMRQAGFGNVSWQSLSGGIVAIHSGWRV